MKTVIITIILCFITLLSITILFSKNQTEEPKCISVWNWINKICTINWFTYWYTSSWEVYDVLYQTPDWIFKKTK